MRRIAPDEFPGFAEPGWAKAAANFRAEPAGPGRTRLSTETRIQGSDEEARRAFGRYWGAIRIGSALIRREWLWAIKRGAER